MVFFPRRMHGALLLLLLSFLLPPATAFDFSSDCVSDCISASRCRPSNERCVCGAARKMLLDSVISCMYFNCKSDLVNYEAAFLDPVEEGCADEGMKIPASKIQAAERLASSYISQLPRSTTTPPPTTTAKAPPATTTSTKDSPKPTPPTTTTPSSTAEKPSETTSEPESDSTTEETTSSSSTSTAVDQDDGAVPTSTTSESLASSTVASPPPAQATESSPSASPTSRPRFGDTNPFATPDSAGFRTRASSVWLGVSAIIALMTWTG